MRRAEIVLANIITVRNVEDAKKKGYACISVESGTILTPAARDRLKELKISLEWKTSTVPGVDRTSQMGSDTNNKGELTQESLQSDAVEEELVNRIRLSVLERIPRPVDEVKLDRMIRMMVELAMAFSRN
jgi:ethanolamine utilization cobalamin adenosyltransferase